jgi:hypothetical protein
MAGFFQNVLTDAAGAFFGSDYLRDFSHASKAFRTNSYQNAPKLKFLFHVYFDINPDVYNVGLSTGVNFGLDVKTIKLPSYTFATHELNQYNRKRIVQTKIKYDPVEIAFHDDQGNAIRNMWYAYYTYYYKDATKVNTGGPGSSQIAPAPQYVNRNIYDTSITGNADWGYSGEPIATASSQVKAPFFNNITVFSMNQHNFAAYTLINPIITRFGHDTHSYAEGSGIMENTMMLDYETVKYYEGAIDGNAPGNKVTGFGSAGNYDLTVSPINKAGSQATILGQGGLLDAAGGFVNDLTPDENGNINVIGAIQAAGTAYNTFKNVNVAQVAKSEVIAGITNQVQQTPNRSTNFSFPTFGAVPGQTAGTATPGLTSPPKVR